MLVSKTSEIQSKKVTILAHLSAFCAYALLFNSPALAESHILAVPNNWLLQNYMNASGVVSWFTGSSCNNGLITLPPSATDDDRNRFFSLILSAKISGKAVGVYYETVSGSCQISSFYIQH